jgi:hypothetical protein
LYEKLEGFKVFEYAGTLFRATDVKVIFEIIVLNQIPATPQRVKQERDLK